jgi:hypothetical protein
MKIVNIIKSKLLYYSLPPEFGFCIEILDVDLLQNDSLAGSSSLPPRGPK